MEHFEKVKTYEPILLSSGFHKKEDLGIRVQMQPLENSEGSFVRLDDYNELLAAYNSLKELNSPKKNKWKDKDKDKE